MPFLGRQIGDLIDLACKPSSYVGQFACRRGRGAGMKTKARAREEERKRDSATKRTKQKTNIHWEKQINQ